MKIEQLEKEYLEHSVFVQLSQYADFYNSLAYSTMGFVGRGTKPSMFNLDMYIFTSLQNTLDSIKETLSKGRINDAYALLRKFYDSTIINIYTNLYLNKNSDSFIVEKIENWRNGKDKIPEFREMSEYVKKSDELKSMVELLEKDKPYKKIRQRCNDHVHYNYYHIFLRNGNVGVELSDKIDALNIFSTDVAAIFIQHFAYLFYLNEHYMSSSDYSDYMDMGMKPEEGSQYWVAPFIQDIFDKWIKPNRPDIADEIKLKTFMELK